VGERVRDPEALSFLRKFRISREGRSPERNRAAVSRANLFQISPPRETQIAGDDSVGTPELMMMRSFAPGDGDVPVSVIKTQTSFVPMIRGDKAIVESAVIGSPRE